MLLAQEFDAVADGQPYTSVNRRRIHTPDTRSRLYGYLAHARVAAPGFRTDGVWVWPEGLAEQVRAHGVAPQTQLYEHVRERFFLLPDDVPEDALWDAAVASAGPVVPDPPPEAEFTYLAAYEQGSDRAPQLYRSTPRPDGSLREDRTVGTGFRTSNRLELAEKGIVETEPTPISDRTAAEIMNRICDQAHAFRLNEARESEPSSGPLRLARVFDGEDPSGTPWFSPARLRLPEAVRRQRMAAYLTGGRLVVRSSGLAADPLSGSGQPVVPLGYRTDGTWVWQEALAYYLLTRGVAPEMEFLCHLEERALIPPGEVSDEVASAAAALATAPPEPLRERTPMTYYQDKHLVVCRARRGDYFGADSYNRDRRWGHTTDLADQFWRGEPNELELVSEAEAVRTIDLRWARDDAIPPID